MDIGRFVDLGRTERPPGPRTGADRTARPEPPHTVVVPLANPGTAPDLLRLARLLVGQDPGRVVGCVVLVDDRDAEEHRNVVTDLREVVEAMGDGAEPALELQTTSAPTVARGVLDTIRDLGADALVMGTTTDDEGRMTVGAIGDSILEAVPCDVFVLGTQGAGGLDAVERVVVTVEHPAVAETTLRVGRLVSRALDRPLELVHLPRPGHRGRRLRPAHPVRGGGTEPVVTTRIPRDRLDAGLRAHLRDGSLVVVGYEPDADEGGWGEGTVTRRVLAHHDVSVLTVASHPPADGASGPLLRRALAWLHPQLTDVEQDSVRDTAASASQLRLDFLLMILLSGAIAAFGLLLDSVAIIIGAMLVAPLMPPIQAFGIAVVDGRSSIAARAAVTVLTGSAVVVVSAFVLAALGEGELTGEVTARGAASLLDAGVALAAGVAGAYATARKTIPAALAGVAIAAAVVPPLAVVGLAAAAGAWSLAGGALLLFTVNILCIAVTTAGVFAWLGLEAFDPEQRRSGAARALLGGVMLLILAVALSVALRADAPTLDDAVLAEVVAEASGRTARFVDASRIDGVDGESTVRVTVDLVDGRGPDAPRDGVTDRLVAAVGREVRAQLGEGVPVRVVGLEAVSAR